MNTKATAILRIYFFYAWSLSDQKFLLFEFQNNPNRIICLCVTGNKQPSNKSNSFHALLHDLDKSKHLAVSISPAGFMSVQRRQACSKHALHQPEGGEGEKIDSVTQMGLHAS